MPGFAHWTGPNRFPGVIRGVDHVDAELTVELRAVGAAEHGPLAYAYGDEQPGGQQRVTGRAGGQFLIFGAVFGEQHVDGVELLVESGGKLATVLEGRPEGEEGRGELVAGLACRAGPPLSPGGVVGMIQPLVDGLLGQHGALGQSGTQSLPGAVDRFLIVRPG